MADNAETGGDCLTYDVPTAGKLLGLGRVAAYKAAQRGDIPVIRIGKLLFVPKAALQRMLEQAGAKSAA